MSNNKITPSQEDYLEAIYNVSSRKEDVRVTDIANELGIAKSSVHVAMHSLKDKEFIEQEHYGRIKLTQSGLEIAKHILCKHTVLAEFLTDIIGVSNAVAEQEACQIEHVIGDETFEKIMSFTKNYKKK